MEEINLFREKLQQLLHWNGMEWSKTSFCVHVLDCVNASKDSQPSRNRHRI
ncbi:MAG: hypothetical protein IM542_03895 [Pseudanabaena sp. M165S2SP1A06QC]|nr:hypothetical protein [Pseudanabaena sp. M165S2SP1A06QC]